jgi:hypothetical protein
MPSSAWATTGAASPKNKKTTQLDRIRIAAMLRAAGCHSIDFHAEAGGFADTRAGWRSYHAYLLWQALHGPPGRSKAYACLSRGWASGSREFKTALVKDHALAATARASEARPRSVLETFNIKIRNLTPFRSHGVAA